MVSSTGVRHERQEVKGSSPVRGKFFADFFSLIQFWHQCQNDLFMENLDCIFFLEVAYKGVPYQSASGIRSLIDIFRKWVKKALELELALVLALELALELELGELVLASASASARARARAVLELELEQGVVGT